MSKIISQLEFQDNSNKKYEIKAIYNSVVYGKESEDQLLDLYYLVLLEGYLEKENTWEQALAI